MHFIALVAAALLLLSHPVAADVASPADLGEELPQIGATDFIAYWSAYQVAARGGNPYLDAPLLKEQRKVGWGIKEPQRYLNPPTTLTILSPILSLPFRSAVNAWIALNIFFVLLISFTSWSLAGGRRSKAWIAGIAGVLFFPAWETVFYGQLSLLVSACLIASVWLLSRGRDTLAAVALVIACQKPHLIFLFAAVVCWWALAQGRRKFIYSLLGIAVICLVATELWLPQQFSNWRAAKFSPLVYQSATLVGWLRTFVSDHGAEYNRWIAYAVPAAASIAVFFVIFFRRSNFSWSRYLLPLLTISVLAAPYGWSFDCALLMPVQIILVAASLRAWPENRWGSTVPIILLLFQGFNLYIYIGSIALYERWWFALAMLGIWAYAAAVTRTKTPLTI